jgi:hypothetical protein
MNATSEPHLIVFGSAEALTDFAAAALLADDFQH